MDMSYEANNRNPGLCPGRAHTGRLGVLRDIRIALEIIVADLGMAGDEHMAHHQDRFLCPRQGSRQPKVILFRKIKAPSSFGPSNIRFRPPKRDLPGPGINHFRGHGLAQDFGIFFDAQIVPITIATDVIDWSIKNRKHIIHFGFEAKIRSMIHIRDPIPKIKNQIWCRIPEPLSGVRHFLERFVVAFRLMRRTVMDIGNDGKFHSDRPF